MERKSLSVTVKADDPGAITAVFSTFNTIDHDGDVTVPGAFEDGAETRLLPAHDWAHYMIGKGVIHADQHRAIFDGRLNLSTSAGRDWYESIKFDKQNGTPMQEFSYGFDVLDASFGEFDGENVRFLRKVRVHEVSPVTLGAGVGTRTLSIKGRQSLDELADYFREHADEAKKLLELLEQKTDDDPNEDDLGLKFADEAERVLADTQALVVRAAGLASTRALDGRLIGANSRERLSKVADEIIAAEKELRALLVEPPQHDSAADEIEAMFQRFKAAEAFARDMGFPVRY